MSCALVYMAAGNSRRFGSNKLLYLLDGKPLYRHLLERLCAISCENVSYTLFFVTRYEQLLAETAGLPLTPVFAPQARLGASHTVRAALFAAAGFDCFAFFAADQPYLAADTVRDFLSAAENSGKGLACVRSAGIPGNPAWFSNKYRDELLALTGDTGGRAVLRAHPDDLFLFDVPDARELMDIDVPPV